MKNSLKLILAGLMVFGLSNCKKDETVKKPAAVEHNNARKTLAVTLASFSPTVGRLYAAVTITGNDFSTVPTENEVKFNGVTGIVNSATATQLVVTVPAGATTGKITVTTNSVTATTATDFKIQQLTKVNSVDLPFNVRKLIFDKKRPGYLYGTDGTSIYRIAPDYATSILYTVPPPLSSEAENYNYAIESIAYGDDGNIYAGREKYDPINFIYREVILLKITSGGAASVVVGSGSGFEDGNAANAKFNAMSDMTTDPIAHKLYIADDYFKIRKVTSSGNVTTLANVSSGAQSRITVDANGNLYFSHNSVIKKIATNGTITTIAGSGEYGNTDGPANLATFNNISSLSTDNYGMYLTDLKTDVYGFYLRVINKAGYVSTFTPPEPFDTATTDGAGKLYTMYGSYLVKYTFQ